MTDPIPADRLLSFVDRMTTRQPWVRRRAELAMHNRHYVAITGRRDSDLYLLRLWLTRPRRDERGELESGDSTLLHLFARGDDDQALHDHPWSFTTTIVQGGYTEHRPDLDWMMACERGGGPPTLGPAWDAFRIDRREGETIERAAIDLHCVGEVQPGTITLMITGPRVRPWGFHPPGRPWMPYAEFLAERKALAAAP